MENKNKKAKSKYSVKNILLILVVIIIIALCVYFLFIRKENENNNENVENNINNTVQETQEEYSLIDMNNTTNVEVNEVENTKINNSAKLKENKTYEGMTIKDITLKAENGMTQILANVENTSGSDFAGEVVELVFINQDGSEYARLDAYIPEVKKGETTSIDANTTSDVSNAFDFSIE